MLRCCYNDKLSRNSNNTSATAIITTAVVMTKNMNIGRFRPHIGGSDKGAVSATGTDTGCRQISQEVLPSNQRSAHASCAHSRPPRHAHPRLPSGPSSTPDMHMRHSIRARACPRCPPSFGVCTPCGLLFQTPEACMSRHPNTRWRRTMRRLRRSEQWIVRPDAAFVYEIRSGG